MYKCMGLLLVLIIGCMPLQAQKKILYIIDSTTNIPISFATAMHTETGFVAAADENGRLNIAKLSPKALTLTISCLGYATKTFLLNPTNTLYYTPNVYLQPQRTHLQDVVISAAANNGIFKTISEVDIHLRPITNSQDVLRLVPGLFIGQHAGGGKAEQLFLRGFDLDHGTDINITVDGMPVNMVSHAHGQGYADLHFVIPEMIDKVHFNKGPYFADKGNFTTAGFVAFDTKNYVDKNFIKAEKGQYNTSRLVAAVSLLSPKVLPQKQHLYVAAEASFTDGYFESPQHFNRFNALLKYKGCLSDKNILTLTATAFSSKWNASGQIPDRAVANGSIGWYDAIDNTEGGNTSRYNFNTQLLTHIGNRASWRNQLFVSKYLFELYSNFTFFKEDPIHGDQIRQKENRTLVGYNSTYETQYNIGTLSTETQAGLQLRYDAVNNIELTRTKNRTINTLPIMLGNVRESNTALYYSQKLNLTKQLSITGALRYDYFTNQYFNQLTQQQQQTHIGIFSPKFNIQYTINSKTQLYWYNGKGFHSNDTRVAVQENGKKVVPPAYGTDVGGVFKIGNRMVLQTALWYLWLDQEFVYVGDEGVVEPGGQTRRWGGDVSVRYQLSNNWLADVDVSIAQPKALQVPTQESYVPLAPQFTSAGGISYRQAIGFNGSLRYRYMANRPANETNAVIAKGYCIVDGTLNYTSKKWELGLAIQNLFNTKWKETQFDTESQLKTETAPVSEIHFTPGTPFFARLSAVWYF